MDDTKSHSDLSKILRTSSDQSRRNSYAGSNSEGPKRDAQMSAELDRNDRNHYWMTILGRDQVQSDSSSQQLHPSSSQATHHNDITSRRPDVTFRSHHHSMGHISASKYRPPTAVQLDVGHTSRTVRKQSSKPFQCEKCSRRFERKGHLKSHIDAVHENQQPYGCHFMGCLRSFSHQSSLNRHLKLVHGYYPVPERNSSKRKDKPDRSST